MAIKQKKSIQNQLLLTLYKYRKAVCLLCEVVWFLVFVFFNNRTTTLTALLVAFFAACAAGFFTLLAILRPNIKPLKLENFDRVMLDLILYVFSYLATLFVAYELSFAVVNIVGVPSTNYLKFILQTIAFLLYLGLFLVYRDPDKLQYHMYAVTYGLTVILDWAVDWEMQKHLPQWIKIDLEFSKTFFVMPFKEAMLLFIILDEYLKAKETTKKQKKHGKEKAPHSKEKSHTPKGGKRRK